MEQNELDKLYDSKIKAIEEFFQDEKKRHKRICL